MKENSFIKTGYVSKIEGGDVKRRLPAKWIKRVEEYWRERDWADEGWSMYAERESLNRET